MDEAALARRRDPGAPADRGPGLKGALVVAAFLALVSAMCFALAAALQQRGQLANHETGMPAGPAVAQTAVTGKTLS